MPNLMKLEFVALDISGKNYLSWILDVEIHLTAMNLSNTIQEKKKLGIPTGLCQGNDFLRHHLDEGLKNEYLTIKDPLSFEKIKRKDMTTKRQLDFLKLVMIGCT